MVTPFRCDATATSAPAFATASSTDTAATSATEWAACVSAEADAEHDVAVSAGARRACGAWSVATVALRFDEAVEIAAGRDTTQLLSSAIVLAGGAEANAALLATAPMALAAGWCCITGADATSRSRFPARSPDGSRPGTWGGADGTGLLETCKGCDCAGPFDDRSGAFSDAASLAPPLCVASPPCAPPRCAPLSWATSTRPALDAVDGRRVSLDGCSIGSRPLAGTLMVGAAVLGRAADTWCRGGINSLFRIDRCEPGGAAVCGLQRVGVKSARVDEADPTRAMAAAPLRGR